MKRRALRLHQVTTKRPSLAVRRLHAQVWRQRDLALHVHDDNTPAVSLYHKYGFALLDQDPSW